MSYAQSASVYDVIYTDMKDYAREAWHIYNIAQQYVLASGRNLLNVACGTGLHDQYLTEWFQVEGIDLDPSMLAIARTRLPDVLFRQADMTGFEMNKRYDLVTCLFSAIGHIITFEGLCKAVSEMAKHLKPGGVLIIEPFIHPDAFKPGHLSVNHVKTNDVQVVRVNRSIRNGHVLRLVLDHFVCRGGKYEEPFTDIHEVAMYTVEEYMEALLQAGLEVFHDLEGLMGRGLFIGRKPL